MSSASAWSSAVGAAAASVSIFLQAPRATTSEAASRLLARMRVERVIGNPWMGDGVPRSAQLEQFDIEHEGGVRGDAAGRSGAAVGELGGDPEAVLRADRHQLQALGPARDHLAQAEGGRVVALVGAVEHGAVEQAALVV